MRTDEISGCMRWGMEGYAAVVALSKAVPASASFLPTPEEGKGRVSEGREDKVENSSSS